MKKMALGCFLAVSAFSFAATADQITGYVSDAHCGAKHHTVSAANTKCVKDMCINGGADPVLVSGDKVMKFDDASKDKAKAFAAKNVTIDGSIEGDTVKINTIDEAK
jgi:aspartate 1-decarboxylase